MEKDGSWICYSYEVGSISRNSEIFCLQIPKHIVESGKLSYNQVVDLLKSHYAYLSENFKLSLYDNTLESYCQLLPDAFCTISENADIDILIKDCQLSELAYLVDKVKDLEQRVWGLEQRLVNHEVLPDPEPIIQNFDIAILYAAPLARKEGFKIKDCENWNLDISKESRRIKDAFRINEINTVIRFEVATLENLCAVLECKPKIIQISCHGYYKETDQHKFVLAFESTSSIGLREEVTQEKLRRVLQPYKNYDGVFFLSSCFSHAIGQVFLDAGIKNIITIHEKCKIHDEAAIEFSVVFYRNFLRGRTIQVAFDEACKGVERIQSKLMTCCCAHNHSKCPIKNQEHALHDPSKNCVCYNNEYGNINPQNSNNRNLSDHKLDCEWALAFNKKYQPNRKPTEEEISKGRWIICCCPGPLVPHNESEKFKLLGDPNTRLFTGTEVQEVQDLSFIDSQCPKPPAINLKVYGRGKETSEILEKIHKNRILIVYGKKGFGKSVIIKNAAKYAYDRKMFKDGVIYIDMKGNTDIRLDRAIAEFISPGERNIVSIIENMQLLIIVDNIDKGFDQRRLESICRSISEMSERTQYSKFCLVLEEHLSTDQAASYEVTALKVTSVCQMIKSNLDNEVYSKIRRYLSGFVKEIDCSPTTVLNFIDAIRLNPNRSFEELSKQFLIRRASAILPASDINFFINYLKARDTEALVFLEFLSYFPAGIYKSDIEQFCKCMDINYQNIWRLIVEAGNSYQRGMDFIQSFLETSENTSSQILSSLDIFHTQGYSETNQGPGLNLFKYLSSLAKQIFLAYIKDPSIQCFKVLKSYTLLIYSPNEYENDYKNDLDFSKLISENSAINVFNKMKKNFKEFVNKVAKDAFKQCVNSKNELSQYIYEICVYYMRIFIIQGNLKGAKKILKTTKDLLKNKGLSFLKTKLKLFIEAIMYYERPNSSESQLNTLYNKVKNTVDFHNSTPCSNTLGERYLLQALLRIRESSEEVEEDIKKAEQNFEKTSNLNGLHRLTLVKAKRMKLWNKIDEKIYQELEKARLYFSEQKAKGLEEKAIFLLGVCSCLKKEWAFGKEQWLQGIMLADSINDNKLKTKFNEKLYETIKEMQKKIKQYDSLNL
ncbi:hypothetical protein SteCoe_35861 [Stentor coeruleus]|uniref:CHAT domain-containing protein n=1 Tax=Stentor coeruleus TaxID=5963 RepID=A0A1R2ARD2_9CILI|nr:hypothetical protein SteCoe_35861 [Stentor coeruleus]